MSKDTFNAFDHNGDGWKTWTGDEMSRDTFKAKGDPVESKDGFPYRADIKWHANDIETLAEDRGLDWSLKQCDDFLFGYENHLQERMCEMGFEVLECYMDDFLSEQEDAT